MDVQKQVEFWRVSAEEDFSAAESLLEKGHFRHSLFFAHLAVEKMLKANVTKQIKDIPPRIHNLIRLAELAGHKLDAEQEQFLREFNVYQLEGRYPDSHEILLTADFVKKEILRAKKMLLWLKKQLSQQ
jgi:HEPN domain-containing protein